MGGQATAGPEESASTWWRTTRGPGMGLALVARAAARVGARTGLKSREGEGSVFGVLLRPPIRP